jgi:hypothetical protein
MLPKRCKKFSLRTMFLRLNKGDKMSKLSDCSSCRFDLGKKYGCYFGHKSNIHCIEGRWSDISSSEIEIEKLKRQILALEKQNLEMLEQLEISRRLLSMFLESNKEIESPLYTLHPSFYTVQFASSIVENNLDILRAKNFLDMK